MVRLLIVLFWISLIVGTYVTGNVLGNWVVCLLALFFFIRSRRRQERHRHARRNRVAPALALNRGVKPLSPWSTRTVRAALTCRTHVLARARSGVLI